MALYKYMSKKYADAFFKRGSLKIGTLHEYKNVEQYGTAIGDDAEGVQVTNCLFSEGKTVDMGSNSPEAQFIRASMPHVQFDPGAMLKFGPDAGIISNLVAPNAYIFCVSHEYDAEVMEEFGGSCFEISKPDEFFKTISRTIRHKGEFQTYDTIEYRSRNASWTEPHDIHPVFMKEPRYAYQKETRAVWAPLKEKIEALYVDVPQAVKYCRPVPHKK